VAGLPAHGARLGCQYLAPASATITTASVTFVKGRLYQWHVMVDRATAPDFSSGFAFVHGATTRTSDWTYRTQQATGSASRTVALYWNVATVTETVALAFTHPGAAGNSSFYGLVEIASGFNSAAPILQSASAQTTSGGTVFVGMAAPATPGNLVCCLTGTRTLVTAGRPGEQLLDRAVRDHRQRGGRRRDHGWARVRLHD
jgi:hypothetical protein